MERLIDEDLVVVVDKKNTNKIGKLFWKSLDYSVNK